MKWKPLFAVLLGLLMVGITAGSATATAFQGSIPTTSNIVKPSPKPQPQYVIYGREWKIDGVYYYTTDYTPKQVVATMECHTSGGCSLSREIQRCISVSVSGNLEVDAMVLKETLGVTIGEQICESTICTGNCKYGEEIWLWAWSAIPIKKIVQREYLITNHGEVATSNVAYAYIKMDVVPKCSAESHPINS